MVNIINWLRGKKTYIIAILVGLVAMAQYMGWISNELTITLLGLLGATGMATMRSAINKINE